MPKTPLRNIRIEDDLWLPAKDAAAERGETVSDVIRRALATYIKGGAVVAIAAVAAFTLSACGSDAGTTVSQGEAPAKVAAPRVSAAPAATPVHQNVVHPQGAGAEQAADGSATADGETVGGTMTVTRKSPTTVFVEVTTDGRSAVFDGTFTGYASDGSPVPAIKVFRLQAAGYAGGPVEFASAVTAVTYTAKSGSVVSWAL